MGRRSDWLQSTLGAAVVSLAAAAAWGAPAGDLPSPEERLQLPLFAARPPTPAEIADRRLLGLRVTGFFDPTLQIPDFAGRIPAPPAPPPARPARRYHLLQLRGPLTRLERAALDDAGATIVTYVPNNGLVLALPPGVAPTDLRTPGGVRFVGPFVPGYKLDPALYHLLRDGPARPGAEPLSIEVELFPDESPDRLLHQVATVFGAEVPATFVRRAPAGDPSKLIFAVPASRLAGAVGLFLHDPAVAWVERMLPPVLHNDNSVWIGQSYDRASGPGEANEPAPKPYTLSGTVWGHGLLGAGQVVAVADTGLEHETCFWDDPANPITPQQVTPPGALTLDPAHRKILAINGVNSFTLNFDGTFRHGTHVATSVAGDDLTSPAGGGSPGHDHGDGMAPAAKIIFEDIGGPQSGSCSTTLFVSSVEDLLRQEHDAGAHISTNSWGTSDTRADEVDRVTWEREEFLALFSAGNEGSNGVNPIATAKNSLTVGAGENYDASFNDAFGILDPENVAAFSSVGPAADGRIKPDLVAPGYRVFSNNFPTQYFSDPADCNPGGDPSIEVCQPSFGGCYETHTAQTCSVNPQQGTSMATPTVAGLAALAREYFTAGFYPGGAANAADARTPSAALLKAALINGARNMTGHRYERRGGNPEDFGMLADAPSATQGWGRVMLEDALYFTGDSRRLIVRDVRNADGLATGASATLQFSVTSTTEPLELTLAWTDPPAASYLSAALINDLDLELSAPDGTLYRGNQWTADDVNVANDKESLPDPTGRDALNNVEGILVRAPQGGTYTVTIHGTDVPGHMGVLTQGYALVITGGVSESAGAGEIGAPLLLTRDGTGDVTLSWGASCVAGDGDYAVYEGTLGDFASHTPRTCSTGGQTSFTLTPSGTANYYLVAPHNSSREGSLGQDDSGGPRPSGPAPCFAREVAVCE